MNDQWAGRKVLVTGGMGFIGSHLSERLAQYGAKVKVLGRYNSTGHRGWLHKSPFAAEMECVLGDVRDSEQVSQLIRGCDVVFHLAALIGIPYSYEAPRSYVQTNVEGTLNVLMACRREDALMVHTSTSEVYGSALRVPIDESHPLQGQSPYSATKIGADKLVESFSRSFNSKVITVRPFNTFGPRQSRRAIIPTIISQALRGDAVCLGSLAPTRDFNYVQNTVDGFLALAGNPSATAGQAVNLGTGKEVSIGRLVEVIGELLGRELRVELEEARTRPNHSEVNRLLADSSHAANLVGWTPRVGLKEGLSLTIEWMKQNIEAISGLGYAT